MKYTIIILSLFLVGCGGKYSDEDITFLSCEYESYDDEYSHARDERLFAIFNNSSEKFSLLINKTRKLVVFADTRSLLSAEVGEPRRKGQKTRFAFLNEEIEKTDWRAKEIFPYAFHSFDKSFKTTPELIGWEEQIEGGEEWTDWTVSNSLHTNTLTLDSNYGYERLEVSYKCVKLDKEIEHMPDWELGEQNRL